MTTPEQVEDALKWADSLRPTSDVHILAAEVRRLRKIIAVLGNDAENTSKEAK